MANWTDKVINASYRGVEFSYTTVTDSGGRRVNSHLLPEKDGVVNEDVGRALRSWTIAGYVVSKVGGDDYFTLREKLIKAFETKGVGVFHHPYRGEFEARVTTFSVTESTVTGNMVNFTVTMVEEGTGRKVIVERKVPRNETSSAKASLNEAAIATYKTAYDQARKPALAMKRFNATVEEGIEKIRDVKKVVAAQEEFKRELYNTIGKGISIAYNIEDLIASVINLTDFGTVPERAWSYRNAVVFGMFDELQELARLTTNPKNSLAVAHANFSAQVAVASAVGLVQSLTFVTYGEVDKVKEQMIAMLDSMEGQSGASVETLSAVADARSATTDYLDYTTRKLSSQRNILPLANTNTLSFCYDVYGNIDDEENIIVANNLSQPGFLNTSTPLRVVL